MTTQDFSNILGYFSELDSSLEKLSNKYEGAISRLPRWTLVSRQLNIGVSPDNEGVVLRVIPDDNLSEDVLSISKISTREDLDKLTSPFHLSGNVEDISKNEFILIGDLSVISTNPLIPPALQDESLSGFGKMDGFYNLFSLENAKKDAIAFWNNTLDEKFRSSSFILEANDVFIKFRRIIKRKNFLERRIHRFIYEHAKLLLPDFKEIFFEYVIVDADKKRKVDFILEQSPGFPALLIELENPVHKIYKKDGDFTYQANHAKSQIAEWVSIIDNNPKVNAHENMSFLIGPKQRMVIIGRGLENRGKLLETRFTDTIIWTYELLLDQAQARWNDLIAGQCRLIGLDIFEPFGR